MSVSLFFSWQKQTNFAVSVQTWLCKDKGILPIQLSQITDFCLCALQVHSPVWMLIPAIRSIVIYLLLNVSAYFLSDTVLQFLLRKSQ